jgi:hypothetical protein
MRHRSPGITPARACILQRMVILAVFLAGSMRSGLAACEVLNMAEVAMTAWYSHHHQIRAYLPGGRPRLGAEGTGQTSNNGINDSPGAGKYQMMIPMAMAMSPRMICDVALRSFPFI